MIPRIQVPFQASASEGAVKGSSPWENRRRKHLDWSEILSGKLRSNQMLNDVKWCWLRILNWGYVPGYWLKQRFILVWLPNSSFCFADVFWKHIPKAWIYPHNSPYLGWANMFAIHLTGIDIHVIGSELLLGKMKDVPTNPIAIKLYSPYGPAKWIMYVKQQQTTHNLNINGSYKPAIYVGGVLP